MLTEFDGFLKARESLSSKFLILVSIDAMRTKRAGLKEASLVQSLSLFHFGSLTGVGFEDHVGLRFRQVENSLTVKRNKSFKVTKTSLKIPTKEFAEKARKRLNLLVVATDGVWSWARPKR